MSAVVERAIAAAANGKGPPLVTPGPPGEPRARFTVTLAPKGRQVNIECPADLEDAEWLELVAFLSGAGLRAQLRQRARGIVVAGS